MPGRKLSPRTLITRIDELRRRHRQIDTEVAHEQIRAWPDTGRLKRLKREKLSLKDAIRLTESILTRIGGSPRRSA